MNEKLVVEGVAPAWSGKGTIAQHLVEKYGFAAISVSGIIKDFAENELGLDFKGQKNRPMLRKAQAEYFKKHKPEDLVDRIMGTPGDRLYVDGIRVPAIALDLLERGNSNSMIIALHCSQFIRFMRSSPNFDNFDAEWSQFKLNEAVEASSTSPYGLNTAVIMEQATHHLLTGLPLEQTFRMLDEYIIEPALAPAYNSP